MKKSARKRGFEQLELFIPAFPADIASRDQQDIMERPFFALSKRRIKPIEYRVGDAWVKITAHQQYGMSTIWDADILIWFASQIVEAQDKGLQTSRRIKTVPYEILKFIKRDTSGKNYKDLKESLSRLQSTVIETNIRQGNSTRHHQFSFISEFIENTDAKGKVTDIEIVIADWLYDGLTKNQKVLTISDQYFDLTGGVERWLYRVLRKHAGRQKTGYSLTFRQLYEKSGSANAFRNFAGKIRTLAKGGVLLEYALEVYENEMGEEVLYAVRRNQLHTTHEHSTGIELPRSRKRPKKPV